MNLVNRWTIVIFLVSLLLVSSCSRIPEEKQCSVDADCVPALCCHATDVVNLENAPDCSGVLCSAVCEPDTLDCGQARALCVEGACQMVRS